ncbi:MAG: flagellin [Phycisphaerae bacterium]|nr:flagellin [Phycisphaerae bacterium]MBM91131.1 flagellin [Phycisphaerae bacterium]
MSRINTNVSSLTAQRVLGQNNSSLGTSLSRLSTGLRINRGKDDPAGLIASENLRAEKAGINAALKNSERADQVVNIAEGGLQEVSNLLTELQGLLTTSANSAGLADSEKEANQLQIDSILQTIDRVAGATSFQGTKLLNGNYDYQVTSVNAGVSDINVRGAKFDGASQAVEAIITQSAQQGAVLLSFGGTSLDLNGTNGSFTVEIAGSIGNRELQFASGNTVTQITAAINGISDVTGIEARASTNVVVLESTDFGSNEYVSVDVIDDGGQAAGGGGNIATYAGDFGDAASLTTEGLFDSTAAANGIRDDGQDIGGTINGLLAVGTGKTLSVSSDFLDVEFTASNTASQTLGGLSAFSITGGGADFQLASNIDIGGKTSIGIKDISARKLGTSDLGYLDDLAAGKAFNVVDGENLDTAQEIVAAAIEQVSSTRGRLGAFQKNTVGATIRSLGIALENTTAAESVIRDADFAEETASLTRNQILVQASTNVLSLANSQPQQVLSLLG